MLKIRTANKNEAEYLTQLAMRSKAHWGYTKEFMDACQQELLITKDMIENHSSYYALAENQGGTVGFYSLKGLTDPDIELGLLFIEPEYIGSGFGRILIEHAMNYAAAKGGKTLQIQGDPNAEGFYKAMGAILTGKSESSCIPGRYLPNFSISLIK